MGPIDDLPHTDCTTSREEPGVGTLGPIDNGLSSSAYSGEPPPPPLTDICFYIQGSLRYTVPIRAFRHFFKRVIVEYTVLASERSPNH
jgi:hypothetical protein